MSPDIRWTLDKALPSRLPPRTWDSHELAGRGRRSIRRRRIGAGIVSVFVVAMAGVLALSLISPGGTEVPPGDQTPSYPLPPLNEAQEYVWVPSEYRETKATEKLTSVLWDYIHEQHPELKPSPEFDGPEPPVLRVDRQLWTASKLGGYYEGGSDVAGSKRVYRQPVYIVGAKNGAGFVSDRTDTAEALRVDVYPKGGFEPGAADVSGDPTLPPRPQFLVDGCDPYKLSDTDTLMVYDFACSQPDAGSGQSALAVTRTVDDRTDDPRQIEITNTVVLYRQDGTAVKASMSIEAPKPIEPSLSTTDLLRLAETMPDTPVT